MIGFYDPKTLRGDGKNASINFINIENIDDVEEVKIDSIASAQIVQKALHQQVTFKMTTRYAELEKIEGLLTIENPDAGTGFIETDQGEKIPVNIAFGFYKDDLPQDSFSILAGYRTETEFQVTKLICSPKTPEISLGH